MDRATSVSNGTIFGVWPLGRSIAVAGALLVLTLVVVEPEASRGLGLPERLVFWMINVGLALAGLYAASWLILPRVVSALPPWLALAVAGIGGALLIAPVGYFVEQALPLSLQPLEDGDEWLDRFGNGSVWAGIAAEFLQSVPEVLGFWMILNLPFLASRQPAGAAPPSGDPPRPNDREPVDLDKAEANRYAEATRSEFISRLPKALGTNVLAISSDLHYLHVYTDAGRCMLLGSLQQAADAMGDAGLRVHRAHWVARRAVVRIIRSGQQWHCLLSNDLKVPISRRNKATVAGWFGHSARVVGIRSG